MPYDQCLILFSSMVWHPLQQPWPSGPPGLHYMQGPSRAAFIYVF